MHPSAAELAHQNQQHAAQAASDAREALEADAQLQRISEAAWLQMTRSPTEGPVKAKAVKITLEAFETEEAGPPTYRALNCDLSEAIGCVIAVTPGQGSANVWLWAQLVTGFDGESWQGVRSLNGDYWISTGSGVAVGARYIGPFGPRLGLRLSSNQAAVDADYGRKKVSCSWTLLTVDVSIVT